jgi:ankyrin repeat protein
MARSTRKIRKRVSNNRRASSRRRSVNRKIRKNTVKRNTRRRNTRRKNTRRNNTRRRRTYNRKVLSRDILRGGAKGQPRSALAEEDIEEPGAALGEMKLVARLDDQGPDTYSSLKRFLPDEDADITDEEAIQTKGWVAIVNHLKKTTKEIFQDLFLNPGTDGFSFWDVKNTSHPNLSIQFKYNENDWNGGKVNAFIEEVMTNDGKIIHVSALNDPVEEGDARMTGVWDELEMVELREMDSSTPLFCDKVRGNCNDDFFKFLLLDMSLRDIEDAEDSLLQENLEEEQKQEFNGRIERGGGKAVSLVMELKDKKLPVGSPLDHPDGERRKALQDMDTDYMVMREREDGKLMEVAAIHLAGGTALMMAAKYGNKKCVETLLNSDSSKDFINARTKDGRTALHYAVICCSAWALEQDRTDIINLLLEGGATLDKEGPTVEEKEWDKTWAESHEYHVGTEYDMSSDWSTMEHAVYHGRIENVKALVEKDGDITTVTEGRACMKQNGDLDYEGEGTTCENENDTWIPFGAAAGKGIKQLEEQLAQVRNDQQTPADDLEYEEVVINYKKEKILQTVEYLKGRVVSAKDGEPKQNSVPETAAAGAPKSDAKPKIAKGGGSKIEIRPRENDDKTKEQLLKDLTEFKDKNTELGEDESRNEYRDNWSIANILTNSTSEEAEVHELKRELYYNYRKKIEKTTEVNQELLNLMEDAAVLSCSIAEDLKNSNIKSDGGPGGDAAAEEDDESDDDGL